MMRKMEREKSEARRRLRRGGEIGRKANVKGMLCFSVLYSFFKLLILNNYSFVDRSYVHLLQSNNSYI